MEARTVILLANGKKKAEVIKRAVEGDVSNAFPASIIQQHADGIIMIDEEAASLLPHTV
jgi:glucosamine-6-phosphate deaminase